MSEGHAVPGAVGIPRSIRLLSKCEQMPGMVARMEELVRQLGAPRRGSNDEEQIRLVKTLKNEIIGNKHKKLSYIKLGAVPRVLELLASSEASSGSGPSTLLVQCAATVGSFSCVADGVQAVVDGNGVTHLLRTLTSSDDSVVGAGARSLKLLFESPEAQAAAELPDEALHRLVHLLTSTNRQLGDVAARLLARCCHSSHQQELIVEAGGLPSLLDMLRAPEAPRWEAGLDALASLSRDNEDVAKQVAQDSGAVTCLLRLLKGSSAHPRLQASTCLTRILLHIPEDSSPSPVELRRAVLQALARLLGEKEGSDDAPTVLASLIRDSPDMQSAAAEADAVTKLANSLLHDNCSARLKEGVLNALAILCEEQEKSRTQVMDTRALPRIMLALKDDCEAVRLAACRCLRSLSRDVKTLRSSIEKADIVPALLRLLKDPQPAVQALALKTVCNVVLDFSGVKEAVVNGGVLPVLIDLTSSPDDDVRMSAVLALQNLSFSAGEEVCTALLILLSWEQVCTLTTDPQPLVKAKALAILQNLAKTGPSADLVGWSDGRILTHVVNLLKEGESLHASAIEAILYLLTNMIAMGTGKEADYLIDSGLAPLLAGTICHMDEKVRLASIWVIINLTYEREVDPSYQDGTPDRRAWRLRTLRSERLDTIVTEMRLKEDSLDIRERADTAIKNFQQDPQLSVRPVD